MFSGIQPTTNGKTLSINIEHIYVCKHYVLISKQFVLFWYQDGKQEIGPHGLSPRELSVIFQKRRKTYSMVVSCVSHSKVLGLGQRLKWYGEYTYVFWSNYWLSSKSAHYLGIHGSTSFCGFPVSIVLCWPQEDGLGDYLSWSSSLDISI